MSGGANSDDCDVYTIYGADSNTPTALLTSAGSSDDPAGIIDVLQGAFLVGGAVCDGNNAFAWTGLDEDADASMVSAGRMSSASLGPAGTGASAETDRPISVSSAAPFEILLAAAWGGAPSEALAGVVSLVFSGSAAPSGDGALAGSAAMALDAVGDLPGPGALAGAASMSLSSSGALDGAGALAGSAQASLSGAGDLQGGAAGPGAHRYWRVYYASVSGGNTRCSAAEIEMRLTTGGADQTGSGTAIASNSLAGAAANAYDNNATTNWVTGSSNVPGWNGYDFGAGNDLEIREVALTAETAVPARSPTTGAIEYSDDNVSWNVALTLPTQSAWGAGETRVFTF
jgi:hypothetical protein